MMQMSALGSTSLSSDTLATPTVIDDLCHRINDLTFGVAQTIEDVVAAWKLVFTSYRGRGLIDHNEQQIHFVPQAGQPETTVIYGMRNQQVVCTLTVVQDGPMGLPLDAAYEMELAMIRRDGRPLVEVGLLADRRGDAMCAFSAVRDLMRLGVYSAYYRGADVVIGVHPHHCGFYRRYWGLEVIGPVKTYATVKDHPVVLMRLRTHDIFSRQPMPRGLAYLAEHPVSESFFDRRFDFSPAVLRRSAVGLLLLQKGHRRHRRPRRVQPAPQPMPLAQAC